MSGLFQLVLPGFVVIVPIYLHSYVRFYGIVKGERPEWLNVRGAFSFLYDNGVLPRMGDPNVTVELIRIAFGARARELSSPRAATYAGRIKFLLCLGIALFIIGITGVVGSAT